MRAWTVDRWVERDGRWATVGGWFAALPKFDDPEQAEQRYRDALAYYLENGTRLQDGRYRVEVAPPADPPSVELEFRRNATAAAYQLDGQPLKP